ncbi:MAG: hypothetical protein HS116_04505 [Planctomycetes bacterium]|nr:hypothetical protein [Planctomycetota bacterium]
MNPSRNRLSIAHAGLAATVLASVWAQASEEAGLAAGFANDDGLARHSDVLFYEDFEGDQPKLVTTPWSKSTHREIVRDPDLVFQGNACLSSQNLKGKHVPLNTFMEIAEADVSYLRFHSCFEKGYEVGGGVKGPGLQATKDPALAAGGGAGIKPTGTDKFGARVCFHSSGAPYLYYYHMDMGKWGSNGEQNQGAPISMTPGRWYAIEMMLKANTPGASDGELKLWIDGVLKAQHTGIRWRTDAELKINYVNHSAYFGGDWTSPKDQKRYEDSMVVARSYIGPLLPVAAKPAAALAQAKPSSSPTAAPKPQAPAPVDYAPQRNMLIERLLQVKAGWPILSFLPVMGRRERVQVAGATTAGVRVLVQKNEMPLKWQEIGNADLARLGLAACPQDWIALQCAEQLARSESNETLAEQIKLRLAELGRE